MRPLNFASQPFRNERLPALLFGVAAVVLLAVTVRHAFVVRALLPARTSKLHKEVAALEADLERLRTESRTLTAPKPGKQALAEWSVLKDLVDRRTFSWTELFARLETVLPREVKLVSIAPGMKDGQVVLDIVAVARPSQAGLGLVGQLERRAEFEDVYPIRVTDKEGGETEFNYTMRYLPGTARDQPAAAAGQGDAAAAPAETAAAPLPTANAQPPVVPAGGVRPGGAVPVPAASALLPAASAAPAPQPAVAPPPREERGGKPPEVPSERNPVPPPAPSDSDAGDMRSPSRKAGERPR